MQKSPNSEEKGLMHILNRVGDLLHFLCLGRLGLVTHCTRTDVVVFDHVWIDMRKCTCTSVGRDFIPSFRSPERMRTAETSSADVVCASIQRKWDAARHRREGPAEEVLSTTRCVALAEVVVAVVARAAYSIATV